MYEFKSVVKDLVDFCDPKHRQAVGGAYSAQSEAEVSPVSLKAERCLDDFIPADEDRAV